MQAAELSEAESQEALAAAGGDLKVAIVASVASVDADTARASLAQNSGSVRDALAELAPVSS